jgi:hypothetical protein
MLCVTSFGLYMHSVHNSTEEKVEEFLDVLLIVLRYSSQALRILVFLRNQHKRRETVKEQYIDLNNPVFQVESASLPDHNVHEMTPNALSSTEHDIELAEHDSDDHSEPSSRSDINK